MKKNLLVQSIILFILISSIISEKKSKKKKTTKTQNKPEKKEEEIPSIYNWAKKNKIYINDKLTLNKNTDSSHNFYYFTTNSVITNNSVLLRVPYDIMISPSSLEKHFQEIRSKKFAYLWEKILENKNPYISYYPTKQYFYIAILI